MSPRGFLVERLAQRSDDQVRKDLMAGRLSAADLAGVTGQCIALGGDRLALWTHPSEAAVVFNGNGWSAAEVRDRWEELADGVQTYGLALPPVELA